MLRTRRYTTLLLAWFLAWGLAARAPHLQKCSILFTPSQYGAHIQNFDIECDNEGRIFVANFEGLLVYDYARWCIYRTDKYTRTEKLVKLQSGRIVVYDYRGNAFILENEELVPCSDELLRQDKVVFSGIRKEVNDLHGGCWSLTEQGILYTARNSAFSFIDESQGLKGEVLSLIDTPDGLYAGTTTGLYLCTSDRFEKLEGINTTCWQIVPVPDDPGYLVATSQGVFYVENRKIVWKYTNLHTLAICYSGKSAWVGELDRLRYFDFDKDAFTQEVSINNPYKILTAKDGTLWVSTLPKCECFYFLPNDNTPHKTPMEGTLVTEDDDIYIRGIENTWVWNTQTHSLTKQTLIENDNEHYMVLFSYTAPNGQSFIGNSNGKGLQAMKSREESIDYCQWCTPFEELYVRAMTMGDHYLAVGGDFGIYVLNTDSVQVRTSKPSVFIRSTQLVDDDFEAYYSTDHLPLPGRCLYATRIDNEEWSGWSEKTHYVGSNLWFGDHTFYVRCRDEFGIESETVTLPVHVAWPYYLRWYAWLLYAMTLTILIQLIIRWRTNRMRKENMRLERIVEERTSRLQEAQKKLARQEKVEMMGKLIQGLIDRILNPMNYILNFAKLTRSLRNDMQADVEDEQERITGENFADMQDILDMMNTNLTKIEEHSTNTTRILKAMEELMHDRNEVTGEMSLTDMLAKCEEMTRTYYHDDIERMGVEVRFDISPEHIILYGNADFISKSIMSMIANSFYSMRKKFEQAAYSPALHVSLEKAKNMAVLKIRDNGLGIEDAIKAKIFDPFFTTKPTAEAPGVGLYLTRDIVQTHHGDITCDSVKGEYCEFIIQLRLDKHRPQKEAAGK